MRSRPMMTLRLRCGPRHARSHSWRGRRSRWSIAVALAVVAGSAATGTAFADSTAAPRNHHGVVPADVSSYCLSAVTAPPTVAASLKSGVCQDIVVDLRDIGQKLGLATIVPTKHLSPLKVIFSTSPGSTPTTVLGTTYFKALRTNVKKPSDGFVEEPCEIVIYPLGYDGETSDGDTVSRRLHVLLAHEVVHCYQDIVFTASDSGVGVPAGDDLAQSLLPKFITEGSATYLATTYAGYAEPGTPNFWQLGWFGRDQSALVTRSYDAVGWYSLIAHVTGASLWLKMANAWRAYDSGGAAAYIAALGGKSPDVERAWAPSVVNNPSWGEAWTTPGIGVPDHAVPVINRGFLGAAGGSNRVFIKPWAAYVDDETSVPDGIVDVGVTNGYASVHDAANHSYLGFTHEDFCVGAKACDDTDVTCDHTGPPVYLAPLAAPFTLAASSDESQATLTITAIPQPNTPTTPVSVGPMCTPSTTQTAYSEGDPHLGTFNGLAYDFQAAGEFTLVRSRSRSLVVQVRQQPSPESNSVSVDTAVAILDGGTRVEIDPGEPPTILVNGTSIALASKVDHLHGGGTLAEHRYGDRLANLVGVSVGWANGSTALIDVDQLGESVAVSAPSRLAGTLSGLLAADVTNSSTPRGSESLIGGNGRRYVLDPDTLAGFHTLYRSFAPTWLVTPSSSLFTYDDGQGTRSFVVSKFPTKIDTDDTVLPKLSPRELARLDGTCRQAGITNGALLDDCVLDATVIGTGFTGLLAELAANIGNFVQTGGHHQAPPSTTTTTLPPPTSGSIAKYFADPCSLLTPAEVEAATQTSFNAPLSLAQARECLYYAKQQGSEFFFYLTQGPVTVSSLDAPGVPVASLGHGALWGTSPNEHAGDGQLDFSLGQFSGKSYAIQLDMLGGSEARAIALARAILKNLR